MPSQCVDGHFRVSGGVLDIAAGIAPRIRAQQTSSPTNNGAFTSERSLPGVPHHDFSIQWTNDQPFPLLVVPELHSRGTYIEAPQPNLVLVRARATVAINQAAPVPDITGVFDSEFGGGFDVTDQDPESTPVAGKLNRGGAAWSYRKQPEILQPGDTIFMRFRMASYTPEPWVDNGNNGANDHNVTVLPVIARFWSSARGVTT
ncbi:DUF7172 family protein [Hoyosella altamirensis]|uniref:DUF7172 family protein n=1 Tax=Hoyosella altamirensis TaxID=616997 RepID=UPI0012EEDF09|nr:hypothetical protein [Hoyosella altamirensis]